jgi:hypothetical protein
VKLAAAALLAFAAGCDDCPDSTLDLVPFTGAHVDHTDLVCDQAAMQQGWTACADPLVDVVNPLGGCDEDLRIALGRNVAFGAIGLVLEVSLDDIGEPSHVGIVLQVWDDEVPPGNHIADPQPSLHDGSVSFESWDRDGSVAGRVDLQFTEGTISGQFFTEAAP